MSVSAGGYVIFMSISTYMSKIMGRPFLHIIAWPISTWVPVIQNISFLWSSSKDSLFALSITPCLLFYDARSVFLWRLLHWPAETETIRCKVFSIIVYVRMFPAACMEDWQFGTYRRNFLYIMGHGAALKENIHVWRWSGGWGVLDGANNEP